MAQTADAETVERGRYLVTITGCNDCHTAGYLASEGQTPEEQWLTGDTFGWRGPWGTTFGRPMGNTRKEFNGAADNAMVCLEKDEG
jgi:mono/diheme cytochrome c family protein